MFHDITMGIPTPTHKEREEAYTVDGMRRAIDRASRDSALIKNCLDSARFNGLSGEDKYVQLAYHALVALEQHYRLHLRFVMCTPSPLVVNNDP